MKYAIFLGALTLPLSLPSASAEPDWDTVAQCESTNTNANTGNGYYGYYQFDLSTWAETGRPGNPTEYSKAEQTQAASELYSKSGGGRWPSCVGGGGGSPKSADTTPERVENTPTAPTAPTAPVATATRTEQLSVTG